MISFPSEVTAPVGGSIAAAWLDLARAEFREMPGMRLTKEQIQKLWNLDITTCNALVLALESDGFLRRSEGAFVVRRPGA
ncbi:MAG TPA: hypothetical protein VHZ73_07890 [Vicinamibacterales bacterium]|jgi:hypothetical protein|nr:hypothetical protein [Vicinamibacterales bacterium]